MNVFEFLKSVIGNKVEITQISGLVISGTLRSFRFEPDMYCAVIVENDKCWYVVNWNQVLRVTIPKTET